VILSKSVKLIFNQGLAKTTAINTVSKALGIQFKRIQFTPDLLPSDLTGAQIYNPKTGFRGKIRVVFHNLKGDYIVFNAPP
jgi:MoxR-like ATPase